MITEDDLPPPMAAGGVVGGVPGGVPGGAGGVIGGIIGSVPAAAPPPPEVEAPKPVTPQRIRVGGNVQAGQPDQEDPAARIRRSPSRRVFRAWYT